MPSHLVLPRLNFTSSFLNFLHPPQWTVQGSGEWSWSARNTVFAAPFSSHFFPAPAPGSFPWLPHELLQCMSFPPGKFFKNCSSVCAFHGVWSFRNRLVFMGLPRGSVLSEKLLLCGFLHRLQRVYLLWCVLPGLQGSNLLHQGLFHRLRRICSGIWSTSTHSFFMDLGVCRALTTMFFSLLFQHSFKICYHRDTTSVADELSILGVMS